MNAVPPSMMPGRTALREAGASALSARWAALQTAGEAVAALAGLEPTPSSGEIRNFPVSLRTAPGWRRELADRGMEDMAAVMEPGIAALLGISASGADPQPAALALWREFAAARAAILALLPPAETTAARHGE